MEPVELPLDGLRLVLVKPGEGVSTREAYAGVRPAVPERPLLERLQSPVATWRECVKNDFEPSVFARHPRLALIKEDLLKQGALYAAMSGSGSTLFGLFADERPYIPPSTDCSSIRSSCNPSLSGPEREVAGGRVAVEGADDGRQQFRRGGPEV